MNYNIYNIIREIVNYKMDNAINDDTSYFKDCYAGCKLDANTMRWKCKIFDNVKEADEYSLHNRVQSKATKLLVIPCLYKKEGYIGFLKKTVGSKLYFGLDFEKEDGKII